MDSIKDSTTEIRTTMSSPPSNENKNILIGALIFLLVLSFLGINLLSMLGGFYDSIVNTFGPIVYKFLALLGFTTGTVINIVVPTTTATGSYLNFSSPIPYGKPVYVLSGFDS